MRLSALTRRPVLLALATLGLSAALNLGPALQSAEANPRLARAMSTLDLNGDGLLSQAEMRAFRNSRFDLWDRNDDGVLDRGDVGPHLRGPMNASRVDDFMRAQDADKDGVVTRRELATGPVPAFVAADRDRDGVLHRGEIQALLAGMR